MPSLFYLFSFFFLIVNAKNLREEGGGKWSNTTGPGFAIYCLGDCDKDVETETEGGIVLMGGGTDVDAAFIWQINKTNVGDFVVIRTTDDPDYNPYIFNLGALNSVTTVCIFQRNAAFDENVISAIAGAEALFLAGGDQWTYFKNWRNTPVSRIINNKINSNVSIGGTSAGCMSLSDIIYNAEFDSVYSEDVLEDPYPKDYGVSLGNNFLSTGGFMPNTVFDTHFIQRDRMGRLVVFLARMLQDSWVNLPSNATSSTPPTIYNTTTGAGSALGIGVDQYTALLIDTTTMIADSVSWFNNGSAYFLTASALPSRCQPDESLIFQNITVQKVSGNITKAFDFKNWTLLTNINTTSYTLEANRGKLTSSQKNGGIY